MTICAYIRLSNRFLLFTVATRVSSHESAPICYTVIRIEFAERENSIVQCASASYNLLRPVDFVVYDEGRKTPLAIGLARYDSDRGGTQEDDRTGGYRDCAREILTYAAAHVLPTKVIFLNDGPGLLLGSMWRDYAQLEADWNGKVMVTTLRMVPERISLEWLTS